MKFPKRATPQSDGISAANYLKIADGQSVTGVLRGNLFEFWQKWPQGGVKEKFAHATPGAIQRFKVNIVIPENGKLAAKVFEFGPRVYDQFSDASAEFDLAKTKIKISRRGSEKNTVWTVMPLGPVDAKALKAIEAINLNILDQDLAQPLDAPMPEHEFPGGVDEDLDEPSF